MNNTPGIATCDGNGDGRIDVAGTVYESTTFWQQLAAASLIPGSFTGGLLFGSGTPAVVSGRNIPKIAGSTDRPGWHVADGDNVSGGDSIALVPGHFGTVFMSAGMGTHNAVLSPAQSHSLDLKYDDGSPVTGRILAANDFFVLAPLSCTDAVNPEAQDIDNSEAQYRSHDPAHRDQIACSVFYVTGW